MDWNYFDFAWHYHMDLRRQVTRLLIMGKHHKLTGNPTAINMGFPITEDMKITPSETLTDKTFECSTEGCPHVTSHPFSDDPRLRWIIDLTYEENGITKYANFCPMCAEEFLDLDEDFYKTMQRTEKKLRDGSLMESVHRAGA
jgi:hypothetical protein